MKTIFFILFLSIACSAMTQRQTTLKVTGIPAVKGQLMIGIYDNAASFPDQSKTKKELIVPVNAKTMEIDLTKILGVGEKVAIAVYHDANSNKKLDKNFFGVPTEHYGFSNDARGVFGPPSFEETAIKVIAGKQVLSIQLK